VSAVAATRWASAGASSTVGTAAVAATADTLPRAGSAAAPAEASPAAAALGALGTGDPATSHAIPPASRTIKASTMAGRARMPMRAYPRRVRATSADRRGAPRGRPDPPCRCRSGAGCVALALFGPRVAAAQEARMRAARGATRIRTCGRRRRCASRSTRSVAACCRRRRDRSTAPGRRRSRRGAPGWPGRRGRGRRSRRRPSRGRR
jgi:hypothetical protein